jgi:hypothetical protein
MNAFFNEFIVPREEATHIIDGRVPVRVTEENFAEFTVAIRRAVDAFGRWPDQRATALGMQLHHQREVRNWWTAPDNEFAALHGVEVKFCDVHNAFCGEARLSARDFAGAFRAVTGAVKHRRHGANYWRLI